MTMNELVQGVAHQLAPMKFKLPMLVALFIAPILDAFATFVFDDWKFLIFLGVLVFLDTVTGVVKAWKRCVVSSHGFTGVILKVFVYGVFVIVLHVLAKFSEKEAVQVAFDWVGTFGYAAVIVRESISIIENLGAIKPGLIPEWILKRLRDFDETGKVS
jgi:toxin secretion/phage lysis holin